MSYQPFAASSSNRNFASFPWRLPNHFSSQGVENEDIFWPAVNADDVEDQEPEYRGLLITFQIPAQLVQPNPYVSAAMVQPFMNNDALQCAHSGAPLVPNMQLGGKFSLEVTPAAQTLNPTLLYRNHRLFRMLLNLLQGLPLKGSPVSIISGL